MKILPKLHKLAIILISVILLLGIPLIKSENSEIRSFSMWLPLLVVGIIIIVNYYQTRNITGIFSNLISLPFVFLGFMWFETFVFTDYRSHLAIFGIPLAIIFLSIGIILLGKLEKNNQ
ncbi:MAG: hypothetical protein ACYC04_01430 [Sulfurovum sp.]